MMTQRKRLTLIVLIILVLLLLLFLVLYLFFMRAPSQNNIVEEPTTVEEPADIIPERPTISEQEIENERQTRTNSSDVISLSKTFVERYGSYSNEADFSNLEDVLPLMSSSFADETQKFIDETTPSQNHYGISTQVITVNVESEDISGGTVRVLVNTQRQESIGSPQNSTVMYQEIELNFVKEGGVWKVDSATWL